MTPNFRSVETGSVWLKLRTSFLIIRTYNNRSAEVLTRTVFWLGWTTFIYLLHLDIVLDFATEVIHFFTITSFIEPHLAR